MTPNHPVTPERLSEVLERFGDDVEAANRAMVEMYAPEVVFQDPIQKLYGREAFLQMNVRLARRARHLKFKVTSAAQSGSDIFLVWNFEYALRFGPTLKVDGCSHLRLENGLVVLHRDYWDLLGAAMDAIPGVSFAYRAIVASFG